MRAVLFTLLLAMALPAYAVEPGEMLADPVQEARARELSRHLRCLVCQSEAIDDSNADLARDLRILVRERIKAGDSDEAVLKFLRDRYGDFILLKPPVEGKTALLWLTPLLILGAGITVAGVYIRRHQGRG